MLNTPVREPFTREELFTPGTEHLHAADAIMIRRQAQEESRALAKQMVKNAKRNALFRNAQALKIDLTKFDQVMDEFGQITIVPRSHEYAGPSSAAEYELSAVQEPSSVRSSRTLRTRRTSSFNSRSGV